jgi:hypothetical protein
MPCPASCLACCPLFCHQKLACWHNKAKPLAVHFALAVLALLKVQVLVLVALSAVLCLVFFDARAAKRGVLVALGELLLKVLADPTAGPGAACLDVLTLFLAVLAASLSASMYLFNDTPSFSPQMRQALAGHCIIRRSLTVFGL